jgi:hypothetical protein
MSVGSYQRAVGDLLPVLDRGLTDQDRFAVLMFVVVMNPEAVLAALEAFRDGQAAALLTAGRASVIEDAWEPARGRLSLALALARARAALRRALCRGGNGSCRNAE